MALDVGGQAPDFTLPGVQLDGEDVRRGSWTLSEQRGAPMVLAFYPGDESAVCTKQLCSYNERLTELTDLGAQVWAISMQGLDSHAQFVRKQHLTFPLLADVDGDVVDDYGIALPGLGLRRAVFVVDADGVLRWRHVAVVGMTFRSVDQIRAQLAAL